MSVQSLIIIAGMCQGGASIASIVIFIWGIFVLISGKFNSRGTQLRGRTARMSGLFLVLQLPLAFFFSWIFFNALSDGDEFTRLVNLPIVTAIEMLFFIIGGVVCAKRYARANVSMAGERSR